MSLQTWKSCCFRWIQSFSNWSVFSVFTENSLNLGEWGGGIWRQNKREKEKSAWALTTTSDFIMSHCRCYGDYSLKETQQKAQPWPIPLWRDFMSAWLYCPPAMADHLTCPQAALKAVSQAEKTRKWWDVSRYASFLCNLVRVLDHHLPFSPSPPQSDSPWVATCPITIQPTRQTPSYSLWHFVLSLFTTGPSGKSVRRP